VAGVGNGGFGLILATCGAAISRKLARRVRKSDEKRRSYKSFCAMQKSPNEKAFRVSENLAAPI